jgi:hypothetical protein
LRPAARTLRLLSASCLLALTSPSRSHADAPLSPPARHSARSPSASACFTSDPEQGTWIHAPGEPERASWRLPTWHRVAWVSDDGEHLVTGFDGVNLAPANDPEDAEIVRFSHRTRPPEAYTLRALGYRRETLQRTVSHYAWGRYAGFDSQGRFRLEMVDGATLVFDVSGGALVERIEPPVAGGARSKP